MDKNDVDRTLTRIAHEIWERNRGSENIAFIGDPKNLDDAFKTEEFEQALHEIGPGEKYQDHDAGAREGEVAHRERTDSLVHRRSHQRIGFDHAAIQPDADLRGGRGLNGVDRHFFKCELLSPGTILAADDCYRRP